MISRPASLLALLLVLALSPCFAQEAAAKRQRVDADTVFLGANVLPMDRERVLENHDVFVKDGRIVAVHPTRTARAGKKAQVIKAQGKYLMPGVSEMHGHYPQEADSELTQSFLFLYVANGVTLVRGMQGGPQHLPLRDAVAKGEVIGPRLLVCAPMLHGHFVRNAEKAEELVREAAKKGFDHLKVHEQLSPAVFDAIASTATEVGLEFSGHVPNEVGLWDALKKGQRTIDHLDGYVEALVEDPSRTEELGLFELGKLAGEIDEKRIASTVKATLDAGAGVVGTMELWEVLFGSRTGAEWKALRPEVKYVPPGMVQQWTTGADQRSQQLGQHPKAVDNILQLRRKVLKALHDADVPVLLGTDSPQVFSVPGFSIHHEMRLMTEAGLTPWEILEAGTRRVAEFYGQADDFGTVAPGRRADLVLLDANPLSNVAHFAKRAGVMVGGRWLSEKDIQARLVTIAASMAKGG